nr:uncharacterized protein LOC129259920 [Lytechinus pictus]
MEKGNDDDKDQADDGNVQNFSSQQELVPNEHDRGGGGGESDYSDMDGGHEEGTADGEDDDERSRRTSAMGRIVGTLQVIKGWVTRGGGEEPTRRADSFLERFALGGPQMEEGHHISGGDASGAG